MASSANPDAIREELAELGRRRKAQEEGDAELAREVTKVLKRAFGKVTVSEAADLLGMHRTTVYRVYHPHG